MNHGTRAGNTVGFDLSCLSKLNETRANDSVVGSLLDFIITTLETNYSESLIWTSELKDLALVKDASWDKVETLIKELKAHVIVAKELGKTIKLSEESDPFNQVIRQIGEADTSFAETNLLYDAVNADWIGLAKQYAKDPKDSKPEAFFQLINSFAEMFDKAIVDKKNNKIEAEKRQNKARAQEEIRRKKIQLAQKKPR